MTLLTILAGLEPTPGSYLAAEREIGSDPPPDARRVNVSMVSTYTVEMIRPYLVVEGARRGLLVAPTFGPYGQLEQQLLSGDSAVYSSDPAVVVIATRIEDVAPDLVRRPASLGSSDVDESLESLGQRIELLVTSTRERTDAHILVFNYAQPPFRALGLAGAMADNSPGSVVQRANALVADTCRETAGAFVFDLERAALETGLDAWWDPRLEYIGRIPLSFPAQLKLGSVLARYLSALLVPPGKCLVVDLDNTLWGGVVGEDGVGGIALGEDYPGNVYKEFQRQLVALRDRGVLLAICSKNNHADAVETFERHSDMVLRLDDFATTRINWDDKASNLRSIADELSLGLDSLAFFDDSAVEREWVRTSAPEVTVIDVPPNPEEYGLALQESEAFDHLLILPEDLARSDMYQMEQRRSSLRETHTDLSGFLRDLDTHVEIGAVDDDTMPRVVQLIGKTNQFNLTARRHTAAQVEKLTSRGGIALWLRATDRFGDNGLVGVAIGIPESTEEWRIDTFLMSCRVIGRGIEKALLSTLAGLATDRGGKRLVGEYVQTNRNSMAEAFFKGEGFEPRDADGRYWECALEGAVLLSPDFIDVELAGL